MRIASILRGLTLSLLLGGSAVAQIVGVAPFSSTGDAYVCDSSSDSVLRLMDLNQDGDYDDAGEVVPFYLDTVGSLSVTNNAGIAVGRDGTVYICDTTTDLVISLRDIDGDGTAHGPGEHRVFFDGNPANNSSGIAMASALELVVDAAGVVWVAAANTSSLGNDVILRLEDLGGSYGANDSGEAMEWARVNGSSVGDSIPSALAIGIDDAIYFAETGSGPFNPRGIYRAADDVLPNGNALDPGEITPFFIPSAPYDSGFHYGMAPDGLGGFFVTDHSSDIIWRIRDINNDGMIQNGTAEAVLWWTSGGSSSLIWSVAWGSDSALYVCETQAPDRILRIADDQIPNGAATDPGETTEVYSELTSSLNIVNPRAIAFAPRPTLQLPRPAQIGTLVSLDLASQANHDFGVWFSTQPLSVAAPPVGRLEISIFAPAVFGPLYGGVLPATGLNTTSFFLPNDPSIVGGQIFLQGFAGRGVRTLLTNGLAVTVTP